MLETPLPEDPKETDKEEEEEDPDVIAHRKRLVGEEKRIFEEMKR